MESRTNKLPKKSSWLQFKGLFVNRKLFERGITAGQPDNIDTNDELKTHDETNANISTEVSFNLNERKLNIFSAKQTIDLLEKRPGETTNKKNQKKSLSIKKPLATLQKLVKSFKGLSATGAEYTYVYNPTRRDEVFLPMTLNPESNKQFGLYLYPWESSRTKKPSDINGFKVYIMPGCLLGSTLQGVDQHKNKITLIRHYIPFFAKQKIKSIQYNRNEKIPYEEMLFKELRNLAELIDKTADKHSKKLVFHLPSYDYMMFGIELFMVGRLTFDALNSFIKAIVEKCANYTDKINSICKEHGISAEIISPFQGVFGPLPKKLDNATGFTKNLLSKLDVSEKELSTPLKNSDRILLNKKFVKKCIHLLTNNQNNYYASFQSIWQDLLDANVSEMNDLEDLLKLANTVPIAYAGLEKKDNEVCTYYPLSEKQIQIGYDSIINIYKLHSHAEKELSLQKEKLKTYQSYCGDNNNLEMLNKALIEHWKTKKVNFEEDLTADESSEWLTITINDCQQTIAFLEQKLTILKKLEENKTLEKFPNIYNLTVLDNLLTYDSTTNGHAFYLGQSEENFCELIEKDILGYAARNNTFFAYKNEYKYKRADNINEILKLISHHEDFTGKFEILNGLIQFLKDSRLKGNFGEEIQTKLASFPDKLKERLLPKVTQLIILEREIDVIKQKKFNLENILTGKEMSSSVTYPMNRS